MNDDFHALEERIDGLIHNLEPGQRKKLGMRLATELQTINARRIKANVTPDGAPMVARKLRQQAARRPEPASKLREARKRMFLRAATARYLRKHAGVDEATMGYEGLIARIMRVHQLGLRDRVERREDAPEANYPARPLLGITDADRERLHDLIAEGLSS